MAEDEKPDDESVLKETLKQIEKDAKEIKKETDAGVAVPKKSLDTIPKIEAAMEKLDERIASVPTPFALGTSDLLSARPLLTPPRLPLTEPPR